MLPKQSRKLQLSLKFEVTSVEQKNYNLIFVIIQFVRYEDTALNPYETAEEVYKFVGLNMTSQVLQWIRQNTGVKAEK